MPSKARGDHPTLPLRCPQPPCAGAVGPQCALSPPGPSFIPLSPPPPLYPLTPCTEKHQNTSTSQTLLTSILATSILSPGSCPPGLDRSKAFLQVAFMPSDLLGFQVLWVPTTQISPTPSNSSPLTMLTFPPTTVFPSLHPKLLYPVHLAASSLCLAAGFRSPPLGSLPMNESPPDAKGTGIGCSSLSSSLAWK